MSQRQHQMTGAINYIFYNYIFTIISKPASQPASESVSVFVCDQSHRWQCLCGSCDADRRRNLKVYLCALSVCLQTKSGKISGRLAVVADRQTDLCLTIFANLNWLLYHHHHYWHR